ncbi:MAG: hypothetical protein QOJ11_3596 [Frankiales bacterium]|nr:hypothetical protein [Frankiales bacterium]
MSETPIDLLEHTAGRTASWTRDTVVTFTAVVILALSFTLGRASIGHSGHSSRIIRPAAVQPFTPVVHNLLSVCRPHVPC